MTDIPIDVSRLIEIIREENPLVLELAFRRLRIEALSAEIAALKQ